MPLHDIVLMVGTAMSVLSIAIALLVWAVPGLPERRLSRVAEGMMVAGVYTNFGAAGLMALHLAGGF